MVENKDELWTEISDIPVILGIKIFPFIYRDFFGWVWEGGGGKFWNIFKFHLI